jgi:hypothetical protein
MGDVGKNPNVAISQVAKIICQVLIGTADGLFVKAVG